MVEFMIVALPRSGTTWAANWLTTDTTLCLHDPLYTTHYSGWDAIQTEKTLGISCTGIVHFPDWLNQHPARKVILHRPIVEINQSVEAIGLPRVAPTLEHSLNRVEGMHVYWTDIFDKPKGIYEFLTGLEFDAERHAFLKDIEMQPNFEGLSVGREVTLRLMNELMSIAASAGKAPA